MNSAPILFLIFNRPDTTQKVFEQIRKLKPTKLFIAADGPRNERLGEFEKCEEARNIVLNNITWPCEIKTLFRDKNLGCGVAVSEAITWFFSHVDQGIILEDDTVPDLSFFNYCTELLNKFIDDNSIMHISGNAYHTLKNDNIVLDSYYFSAFPFIWGWATWRRAWACYEFDLIKKTTTLQRQNWIRSNFKDSSITTYWENTFNSVYEKDVSFTWDYQWFLSIWKNNGIAVLPNKNLVKNIGWSNDATHTTEPNHHLGKVKSNTLILPILHPKQKLIIEELDFLNFKNFYLPFEIKRNFVLRKVDSIRKFVERVVNRANQIVKG
jgi:hypothetical protein